MAVQEDARSICERAYVVHVRAVAVNVRLNTSVPVRVNGAGDRLSCERATRLLEDFGAVWKDIGDENLRTLWLPLDGDRVREPQHDRAAPIPRRNVHRLRHCQAVLGQRGQRK